MPKRQGLLTQDLSDQMMSFSPDGAESPDPGSDAAAVQRAFAPAPPQPNPAQDLQQSVAYGATQDPDQYARQLQLQQKTGVAPQLQQQGYQKQLQQSVDQNSLDYPQFVARAPRTASWASNPDNAAVSGVPEIHRLGGIEDSRTQMAQVRAWNPSVWESIKNTVNPILTTAEQKLYDLPLTRMAISAAGGITGTAGDVASFAGWHGDGPTKENLLQKIQTGLKPENVFAKDQYVGKANYAKSNGMDQVAPILASMAVGMGEANAVGWAARMFGWSERAAKVATALSVGATFSAQAGGQAYTQKAASGGSDDEARTVANQAFGVNLIPNTLAGFADMIPGLNKAPVLASVGTGALMGAAGKVGENLTTGTPWREGTLTSAAKAAALQGGIHIGLSQFGANLGEAINAAEGSELKARSPEKFNEAMQNIFGDDPSLRIPSDQFSSYFKGQKMDPAAVASDLGSSNYAEAVMSGGEVEVPTASFLSNLDPEHQKALLPDIMDPASNITLRQQDEGRQEIADWEANGGTEKMQADFVAASAETAATPEYADVKEDLRGRYVAAGETPEVAETLATKDANVYTNMAREAGMKPSELLSLYNPKVTAGEAPADAGLPSYADVDDESSYREWTEERDRMRYEGKALHDMSPDELDAAHAEAKGRDSSDLKELFGEDGAKQYAKLQRASNSTDHVRADAAFDEVQKMEEGLSPAQRDRLFGIGDNRPQLEEIDEYRTALGHVDESSPNALAESLRYAVGRVDDPSANPAQMTTRQQVAYAQLRHGFDVAKSQGWDTDAIIRKAVLSGAQRFSDPEDAVMMLEKVARSVSSSSDAAKALSEGTRQLGTDVLFQSGEDQPRGWFRTLPDGSFEIGKTKIGDLSTFVHEPAHSYLFMLRDLANRDGSSDTLKGDYSKVLNFLDAKDGEPLTTEQHEKWAQANEQYLREGKAPSPGLRGVFQRFSVWLGSVYQKASSLGVDLSPEIRDVFDRMYAAEDGVNKASQEAGPQLFKTPEEAGWTPEQFQKYADDNNMTTAQAKSDIIGRLNEAAVRDRSDAWREEEKNVRQAVTDHVDSQPEYKAIRSLRKGELEDGTPLTMNKDALVQQFGEDRVKALQEKHPGLYRTEGGTDAETAAEIHGFGSGEEMMQRLEAAPRRSAAIDTATQAFMTAKHGDIRYDGTLDDQARLAVENDNRSKALHAELTALKQKVADIQGKKDGQQQAMRSIEVAPIASYREAARQMIDSKSIVDLQPTRYLDASRKYSSEAFDALRRGDTAAAAEAKHKELMNHFLFREAKDAQDYANKFAAYAKRVQGKTVQQNLGKAGQEYRSQFNKLMARYEVAFIPGGDLPSGTLTEWANDQYEMGKEPAIDASIYDETRTASYRSIPMSELRLVHDALLNIKALAYQELRMIVNGRRVDFEEAMANMINRANESLESMPTRVLQRNATIGERANDIVQRGDALLMRTERLIEWLDGGKTGPWHDNLWHLAADSQGEEYAMQEEITKKLGDSLEAMTKEQRMKMLEKVPIEGITEPITRHDLVSMALNMGNEGNLDRLHKTFESHGWDPAAVDRVREALTREEWQHVQDVWDTLKPLGERMRELETRLTGLPPAMVTPTPFKAWLADGTSMQIDGGYFPIMMDPRFSARGADADAGTSAQNLMETGYGRAETSKGYTKGRRGYGGPLNLDYEQVLTQHTAKVIKDISHREFMLSANKLLKNQGIRDSLRSTLGAGYEEKMMPWLRSIINDRNGSAVQGLGDFSRLMRTLRTNLTLGSLAFKISTSLLQWTHAPRMLLSTTAKSYSQAMVDFLAHPVEMTQQIRDLSPNEMRFRGENQDRDVREMLQQSPGIQRSLARIGNVSIKYTDHLMSFALWLSAYRDALKEHIDLPESEAQYQAAHKADSAVRLGLGAGAPKDLPPIMRNGDLNKFITMFYSFHNGIYNQVRDIGHTFAMSDKGMGDVGKLTYGMALSVLVPSVLSQIVTGKGPQDGENKGLWAAKRSLLFGMDTMPILRDVASALDSDGEVKFNPLMNVLSKGTKATQEALGDSPHKDWKGIELNALESGMDLAGIPGTTQIMKPLHYMDKVSKGKVANPNAWDALVGSAPVKKR